MKFTISSIFLASSIFLLGTSQAVETYENKLPLVLSYSTNPNEPVLCTVEVETTSSQLCKYRFIGTAVNPFSGKDTVSVAGTTERKKYKYQTRTESVIGTMMPLWVFEGGFRKVVWMPALESLKRDKSYYTPEGEILYCENINESIQATKGFLDWIPAHYDENKNWVLGYFEREVVNYTAYSELNGQIDYEPEVTNVRQIECHPSIY